MTSLLTATSAARNCALSSRTGNTVACLNDPTAVSLNNELAASRPDTKARSCKDPWHRARVLPCGPSHRRVKGDTCTNTEHKNTGRRACRYHRHVQPESNGNNIKPLETSGFAKDGQLSQIVARLDDALHSLAAQSQYNAINI